jgi:hypothetical protein
MDGGISKRESTIGQWSQILKTRETNDLDTVDTERGENQNKVQFKKLFQLILKPFNYIQ